MDLREDVRARGDALNPFSPRFVNTAWFRKKARQSK
jgi:hypothetical protein